MFEAVMIAQILIMGWYAFKHCDCPKDKVCEEMRDKDEMKDEG